MSKPQVFDDSATESTDISDPKQATRAKGTAALCVVMVGASPGVGGAVLPLRGVSRIFVGRSNSAELIVQKADQETLNLLLPDSKVSAQHGWLIPSPDGLVLFDTNSKNGWYVGGQRVGSATPIAYGTPIMLGSTLLVASANVVIPSTKAWPFSTTNVAFYSDLKNLQLLSSAPVPILLHGESGVGKEVVAQAIHTASGRPKAFVPVNCGAIPAALLESQLFGHKRGAFSGAIQDSPGYFQAAHQGTLLLDEIGDLPLNAQPALLRVLQQGEVFPVGSVSPQKVDVRVLAATHKPLEELVAAGKFRADLYARLRGFVVTLPPLRERREDLGFLIAAIVKNNNLSVKLSAETVLNLYERDYFLNVRELSQTLVTAACLAENGVIQPNHLPPPIRLGRSTKRPSAPPPPDAESELDEVSQALREELEHRLKETNGNISQVARDMGKARQQIQRWVRRFGLRGE